MAFVNNFRVGADPEFVVMEPPAIVNAQRLHPTNITPKESFFGWDHNGFVVEPHPTPDISVRKVVQNIKRCLDGLSVPFGNQKWRAGAYIAGNGNALGNNRRHVGLGGHVHLDFTDPTAAQIRAFDAINQSLLALEILPSDEATSRTDITGYGGPGDLRYEHGHMEYRSLCSWLFSRKASMLSMTAIKLAAVDPASVSRGFTSKTAFRNWFELFASKDDDAKWIVDKEYFDGDLTARPDRDMKSVWNVDPEKGKELYTEGTLGSIPLTATEEQHREYARRLQERARQLNAYTEATAQITQGLFGGYNNAQQLGAQQANQFPTQRLPVARSIDSYRSALRFYENLAANTLQRLNNPILSTVDRERIEITMHRYNVEMDRFQHAIMIAERTEATMTPPGAPFI